jgi:hypothetical protein
MADEVVVKGAGVSLSPAPSAAGAAIVTTTHTLSTAGSGPFATGESKEILLQSDIDLSFVGYTTSYSKATYVGGTLMYQSLKSVSNLSELTKKNGEAVVLKKTTGTITCIPSPPANDPNAGPDATLSYDLDFSFTDAAQTLAKSD